MARELAILAIASKGGHWEQLMLLRHPLAVGRLHFVTTLRDLAERDGVAADVVCDCSRDDIRSIVKCSWQLIRIMRKVRPDVVVSTGAAPGLLAILLGRIFGARGIWIDSVANAEALSLSGRLLRWGASVRLTQWEHLARAGGPEYWGRLL